MVCHKTRKMRSQAAEKGGEGCRAVIRAEKQGAQSRVLPTRTDLFPPHGGRLMGKVRRGVGWRDLHLSFMRFWFSNMPGTGPQVVPEQTSDSCAQRAAHSPGGTGFPVGSGLPPRMVAPRGGAMHGDLPLILYWDRGGSTEPSLGPQPCR